MIKYVARKIRNTNAGIDKLNMVVHHTLTYSYSDYSSTNAPEGIHEDGMDYIVSALVIERKNIIGGKSVIYGKNATTSLLEVTLKDGQGIFHPDKGSDLWHTVTPCTLDESNRHTYGYRSTIGIDINILN